MSIPFYYFIPKSILSRCGAERHSTEPAEAISQPDGLRICEE